MMRDRPGIVHLHAPLGGLDGAYFRMIRGLGPRVVYTAHDARPLDRDPRWLDWERYRAADHVFVHSRSCAEFLLTNGIDSRRISRIPHGSYAHLCLNADLPKHIARQRLGLAEREQVVLFFGAFSPYKGLETLIPAFHDIVEQSSSARLVLAGEALMEMRPISDQIRSRGLSAKVLMDQRYIPFEEFANYFRSADIVVLPYHRVSQSGVLQLAYGFGRAVIVTDVGGLGEAVKEDVTGLVVAADDSAALGNAILSLLADPVRAEEMGKRARLLAHTKYSWKAIGESTSMVYRAVGGI